MAELDVFYQAVRESRTAQEAGDILKYIRPVTPLDIAYHLYLQAYVAMWKENLERANEYWKALTDLMKHGNVHTPKDEIPHGQNQSSSFPRATLQTWIDTEPTFMKDVLRQCVTKHWQLPSAENAYETFKLELYTTMTMKTKMNQEIQEKWYDSIDRIMIANLVHRADRRASILKELIVFGFPMQKVEVVEAIWHENGAYGASQTHASIVDMILQRGYTKPVLVLEDDIEFRLSAEKVHHALQEFFNWHRSQKSNTWFVCNLTMHVQRFASIAEAPSKIPPCVKRVIEGCEAAAYFVNSAYAARAFRANLIEGAKQLLATGEHWKYALDQYWKSLQRTEQWFAMVPMLCEQIKTSASNTGSNQHDTKNSSFLMDQILSCVIKDQARYDAVLDQLPRYTLLDSDASQSSQSSQTTTTSCFPMLTRDQPSPHRWRHMTHGYHFQVPKTQSTYMLVSDGKVFQLILRGMPSNGSTSLDHQAFVATGWFRLNRLPNYRHELESIVGFVSEEWKKSPDPVDIQISSEAKPSSATILSDQMAAFNPVTPVTPATPFKNTDSFDVKGMTVKGMMPDEKMPGVVATMRPGATVPPVFLPNFASPSFAGLPVMMAQMREPSAKSSPCQIEVMEETDVIPAVVPTATNDEKRPMVSTVSMVSIENAYDALLLVAEQHTPKVLSWWESVRASVDPAKAWLLFYKDSTNATAKEIKQYPGADHVLYVSEAELLGANPLQKGTWHNTETHLVLWWRWLKGTHFKCTSPPASVVILEQQVRSCNYDASLQAIPQHLRGCDFLAKNVEPYGASNRQWYWWDKYEWMDGKDVVPTSAPKTLEQCWKCFRPMMRLSSRFLDLLSSRLGLASAYGEMFLPTLAKQYNLTVGSLNGTAVFAEGEFEPDRNGTPEETLIFKMNPTGLYYPVE